MEESNEQRLLKISSRGTLQIELKARSFRICDSRGDLIYKPDEYGDDG